MQKCEGKQEGLRICPASHMEIVDDDYCSYGDREQIVKVYGVSDDLVEIDGSSYWEDEIDCYDKDVRIWFCDGTVIRIRTDKGTLLDLVAGADIVVCASGQKGLLDWTCVPDGCTVINVGGDYDECDASLNLIPFKGGVGPVTTAVLMSHVLM